MLILAGATGAKEEAIKQDVPQQGVELLFPAGTGKSVKGAKLSKEQKKEASLLQKLKAIEKGGNVNAVDNLGQTALMYAAAQDNKLATCWLVAKGADATIKNKKGKTARDYSTTIAVRELLRLAATEKTALTKEQDKEYELVKDRSDAGLHAELKRAIPYVSDVAVLLKLGKVDLNAPDADGALVLAYKDISAESAAYCIRHGADVHKRNGKGEPVLVGNTSDDVALLLLSLGLKADETKPAELPASFLSAVYTNDCDKVKALSTTHPDLAKKVRSSIILSARSAGMAHALIDAGADYKECWYNGGVCKTRLCAVLCGTPAPVIKVLIDAGAAPDDHWEPEIGLARDAATVEVLIAAGQSPNVKSKWGKTALESALEKRHWEAAECLIAHGAELPENILNKLNTSVGYTTAASSQTQMEYGGIDKDSDWRERQDSILKMPHMLEVLLKAGAKITEGGRGTWYGLGASLFSQADCEDLPMDAHLKAAEDAMQLLLKNSKPPKGFFSHLTLCADMSDRAVINLLKKLIDAGVEMPSDLQGDIALCPAAAEFLLQHGANPNSPEDAPMFRLKESNDPARLYAVLRKYNARIDITDEDDRTPLHHLCDRRTSVDPELVHAMIRDGADVNARDKWGETPLHFAPDKAVAQVLIQDGADVNARKKGGYTPLHLAEDKAVAQTLIQAGADVNARDEDGETPLHLAKDKAVAQALITAGADVNARDKDGKTPLHSAEDEAVAQALITAGADVNARDKDGKTPLHSAKDKAVAQALITAGADVKARDNQGNTPLLLAKDKAVAIALIQAGADVHVKDGKGRTPIFLSESLEDIKIFAQYGLDINAQDNDGNTALMRAVIGRSEGKVQAFLEAGADPNIKNKAGKTALQIAQKDKVAFRRDKIVKSLKEHGAKE